MVLLRQLRETDAQYMLEWMHDESIQSSFKKNMLSTTIEEAISFCNTSIIKNYPEDGDNFHFAIVDDNDEYLGTISLKNFDMKNLTAEYAIALRKCAQGKGIAYNSTIMLLKKAFYEYGIHRIYLNVFADNIAAIKLYEKCGFVFEGEFREHIKRDGKYVNWKWYGMLKSDFDRFSARFY